jgi:hypothetical protein
MRQNRVVVRLKDGGVVKGTADDFSPIEPTFHLKTEEGYIDEYYVEELKALFFVKDYDGDKTYSYSYDDTVIRGGSKVKVCFADGEKIIGYTEENPSEKTGFFITPADLVGNNEKGFIVISATTEIQYL